MHGALAAALLAPWLRDPLWARARMVPSLDLRFAETQSLRDWVSGRDLVTFTRASNGTRATSAGGIETLGNDVPRFTHDPVTRRCLGLLVEEARTNLLLNSATLSTQSVSVTATAHTLHFTGTGTVTLSGASTAGPLVGTGTGEANRVSLTFTPSAGTLTLTVSGTVSNAQLEPGSFRTSWVPTTGTAATRAADIATITGANFSSWYRQDEGTMLCITTPTTLSGDRGMWAIGDPSLAFGSRNGFYSNTNNSTGLWNVSHAVSGVAQVGPGALSGSFSVGETRACAYAYALNNSVGASGGTIGTTDTACNLPTGSFGLSIGSLAQGWSGATNYMNAPISRLIYWPRRLPDHILQELTR